MAELDPELASWLQGSSQDPGPQTSKADSGLSSPDQQLPQNGASNVDPELAAWLSGGSGSPSTSPAARAASPSPGQSTAPSETPVTMAGRLLDLVMRPGRAVQGALGAAYEFRKAHPYTSVADQFNPMHTGEVLSEAWKGAKEGWSGQRDTHLVREVLQTEAPQFVQNHPYLTGAADFAGSLALDPLMHGSGKVIGSGIGAVAKGAGALALGTPEAMAAVETMANPLMKLAETSKAGQAALATGKAAQTLARTTLGMVSLEKGLSHLPQGKAVYQAIREFGGRQMAGQLENRAAVRKVADALKDATPEEKQALAYLLDSPTAAEADAMAAQSAQADAAAAAKDAEWKALAERPAPWDNQPGGPMTAPWDPNGDIFPQQSRAEVVRQQLEDSNPFGKLVLDKAGATPSLRGIHALAAQGGLDHEALGALAKEVYGVESLKDLSVRQVDELAENLAAGRVTKDTMYLSSNPRLVLPPSEAEQAATEQAYLEAERAGMTQGAHDAALEALQGNTGNIPLYAFAGVPEHLRPAAEAAMLKYGHIIPDIRQLTDAAYNKILQFAPETGYQPYYFPRISRPGAEGENPLMKTLRRVMGEDAAPGLTKEGQVAGKLTQRPGFTQERQLERLRDYVDYAAGRGRHAVLDPTDALLTHMDQATRASEAGQLRDRLLGMGEDVAVKGKRVPPGYMDMSHVPGWHGISVQKDIGRALQSYLVPVERSPLGALTDKALGSMKSAVFYNPLIHGKNLAYRAYVAGDNPLMPLVSRATRQEVRDVGPTLQKLIEHGGATRYSRMGEAGAEDLYRGARTAAGEATAGDVAKNTGEAMHNAVWQYDNGLRVQMADKLRAQGMDWPQIAEEVNKTFGRPLDQTPVNLWLRRLLLTPSWTANNLAFNAENLLNPRYLAWLRTKNFVNQLRTGHPMYQNARGSEEYTAVTPPGEDGKQTFVNVGTPDRDLTEAMRNPADYLWQRGNPLLTTAAGMMLGNSRPFDEQRGLDYSKPGQGGPLIGYGSNGVGPDVDLRTQAMVRALLPAAGFPVGTALNETGNALRSQNPERDLVLRLMGMYAKDSNEAQQKGFERRDALKDRVAALRARAKRMGKR